MNKILEPSLLAFSKNYLEEIKALIPLGIQQIHFDIMDGEYVANVSQFNATAVKNIRQLGLDVTVHLMGFHYLNEATKFLDLGIKSMTFQYETLKIHPELEDELLKTFACLKEHGIKCGIAFNPATPFSEVASWIAKSDIVTVMTVVAGKGGQAFCEQGLINLHDVYQYKILHQPDLIIQIDGGVNVDNIEQFINEVDFVVSGSSFYKADLATKTLMINKVQHSYE